VIFGKKTFENRGYVLGFLLLGGPKSGGRSGLVAGPGHFGTNSFSFISISIAHAESKNLAIYLGRSTKLTCQYNSVSA
jgi:hypothetical protein